MQKLSTGHDATLGNYHKITVSIFGEDDPAVKFLDEKIAEAPNGENEEVIAEESQIIELILSMERT